jgi:hypothetical protein
MSIVKKYKHLKMSVLRETLAIDYNVALTQPNRERLKTQPITIKSVSKDSSVSTKKILLTK